MVKLFHSKKHLGTSAEEAACDLLRSHKFKIVTRNYVCKFGEIDIIAKTDNTLVFIEVRHRTHLTHGSSIDSVTTDKFNRIMRTMNHYLLTYALYDRIAYRIDLIGFDQSLEQPIWVKNVTL